MINMGKQEKSVQFCDKAYEMGKWYERIYKGAVSACLTVVFIWVLAGCNIIGGKAEPTDNAGDFLIVEYGTTGCAWCTKLKSVLIEINKETGGALDMEFVYLDRQRDRVEEAKEAGIGRGVPFLVVYDAEDEIVLRLEGFSSSTDIKTKFREVGILQ